MLTQVHGQDREVNRRGFHELLTQKSHGRAWENRDKGISQGGLKILVARVVIRRQVRGECEDIRPSKRTAGRMIIS